jgi:hypothetical protein
MMAPKMTGAARSPQGIGQEVRYDNSAICRHAGVLRSCRASSKLCAAVVRREWLASSHHFAHTRGAIHSPKPEIPCGQQGSEQWCPPDSRLVSVGAGRGNSEHSCSVRGYQYERYPSRAATEAERRNRRWNSEQPSHERGCRDSAERPDRCVRTRWESVRW